MRGVKSVNRLFLLTVLTPTLCAMLYYGLIASDIYVSESRFLVRSPQRPASTNVLGSLLQTTGLSSRSQEDANAVHDFVLSRDALTELNQKLNVRQMFSLRGIDVLTHFPGIAWWEDSFEALYRYYPRRVSVDFDSSTSISVLRVSAFSAADARQINELLLKMSERLVNQINERARLDTIAYARAEVQEAERRAKEAALALATFRNQRSVIDPERQSALQLQGILKLQEELFAAKSQLTQLTTYTPNNPQIPSVRTRVESLQKEIDSETAKVAGGSSSLANKASAFERFALERAFAEKQLATAMAALEAARSEAQRQTLYLERIAQPNEPDVAIEPRRIRSIFVVFVVGMILWGILTLLVAGLREHVD